MTEDRPLSPVVTFRGWPGMDGWRPPAKPSMDAGLGRRIALVLFGAGDAGAPVDQLGLAGYLVVRGSDIIDGGLVVPDDLAERDPAALAEITAWAEAQRLDCLAGSKPWGVTTLGAFCDPLATVEANPSTFTAAAYARRGSLVIGAELGRTLGLMAEHVVSRTGRNAESFELWLPGVGIRTDNGRISKVSPHRPPLWLSHQRQGWRVQFAPCPRGYGEPGRHEFIDVLSLAYTFDAARAAGFAEHAAAFDITTDALPVAVPVSAEGAEQVASTVHAVHDLAVSLDAEASQWFTDSTDRRDGVQRVHLAHPRSASALAALIPARLGVTPPLGKFRLSDAEHAQWAESFNGGRCDDDCRFRNRPFSGALVDVTSAFPLVAHLVDWWAVSIASTLRHRDVTTAVRRACERAASDPTSALDPALWRRLGVTLVEVVPDGEPFPIELDDHARPDGRTEVVPVFSPERPLFKPWPDVVAAAAEGGRAPLIVRATRLVPGPPEPGLRKRLPFLPGTVLSSDRDPAVALVRRRWQAKAEGDKRLARVLHAQVSALVSGNPSRFDPIRRKVGGRWEPWEGPGPWAFLPIACTVQSGARLLLAVLDRLVRDLGGVVAYRDTDSSVIPSSPDGGTITLPDGSTVRELSWAAVDSVLAPFSRLSPEPAWEVWKVERGTPDDPLQVVVFGPKRHAQFVALDDDLPRMDEWTSAGLGGMWAAPPRMTRWTKAAVEREIAYAVARQTDPEAVRSPAPWERAGNAPFPTMRRLMVTSPEVLRSLPGALGARPGSRYLVGVTDTTRGRTGEAVALDPGGSLDGWQRLRWVVRGTGAPIAVSTTPSAKALRFETLDFRATGYAAPPKGAPITEVHIDPTRIRHRGRVSGVIDASDDGLPGDLAARRPVYDEPDLLATVHAHARTLGPAAFARRTDLPLSVAKRAAGGRPISKRNVLRAVRALAADPEQGPSCGCGCGQPVDRRLGAIYVNDTHRARAKKRRQRATPTTSDQERRSA